MNQLNSVLLEGKLEVDPKTSQRDGRPPCSFRLLTVRSGKPFRLVFITDGHLAGVCSEYLREGREVRVVGSLREENDKVWIAAAHVEFRPPKEKSK